MKLELNVINVKEVRFGRETAISNGVLTVNREELKGLLKEDTRLGDISIELANPDDKCRITRVMDAVQPRARAGGNDFPGALSLQGSVGHGSTCVLRGAAVLTSEAFPAQTQTLPIRAVGATVDMWGPGAEVGPYGKTCNVIVMPSPSAGTTLPEYQVALKLAGLKTAVYLARAGIDRAPDEVEVFELPPLSQARTSDGLPRVAYIMQVFSNQFLALPEDPVFYGDNLERLLPTIVHPNEILDGALTAPFRNMGWDTYQVQNHPTILELYRNHGKTLYFAGVIITNAPNNGPTVERASTIAANLAKWTLGADGAVLTKTGGGAPNITLALAASKCEALGIRTVAIIPGAGGDATALTLKPSTLFNDVPGVDAMISLGGATVGELPAADRAIGMDSSPAALTRPGVQIKGASDQIGLSSYKIVQY